MEARTPVAASLSQHIRIITRRAAMTMAAPANLLHDGLDFLLIHRRTHLGQKDLAPQRFVQPRVQSQSIRSCLQAGHRSRQTVPQLS